MAKLPVNDPRWLALHAAIELRRQQTGSLALPDVERALAAGKLRSMRRRADGAHKFDPASFWSDHFVCYLGPSFATICRQVDADRHKTDEYGNLVAETLKGWLFFVWKPDFEKHWLAAAGTAQIEDSAPAPPRITPGPKPTGDWPKLIAQWLIEVAAEDPKRLQNIDALVAEAKLFLDNRIGWSPKDDKDLRTKIRELLPRTRR